MTKVELPVDGPGQAGDDAFALQNAARSVVMARQQLASPAGIDGEMIEAGLGVFLGSYPDSGTGDMQDRKMVVEIFLAMLEKLGS